MLIIHARYETFLVTVTAGWRYGARDSPALIAFLVSSGMLTFNLPVWDQKQEHLPYTVADLFLILGKKKRINDRGEKPAG